MAEFAEVIKKEYEICGSKRCRECPLNVKNNGYNVFCNILRRRHPEEYERIVMEWKPKTDWSKVNKDDKVICTNADGSTSHRHFSRYDADSHTVWTFSDGLTRWSCNDKNNETPWNENDVELWNGDDLTCQG